MMTIEAEDWNELVEILQSVRAVLHSGEGGDQSGAQFEVGLQSLRSFHAMAAMLGMQELEQVGIRLEEYLEQHLAAGMDDAFSQSLDLALGKLVEEVRGAANGGNGRINGDAVLNIFEQSTGDGGPQPTPAAEEVAAGETDTGLDAEESAIRQILEPAAESDEMDLSQLRKVVEQLGGQLILEGDEPAARTVQLRFQPGAAGLEKIASLLVKPNPTAMLASEVLQQDKRLDTILAIMTDFMHALSAGEVKESQEILLRLAKQQRHAGLYGEIGTMARELHTSLKGFMETLDPTLREMVEDRLPDSGNRLEHILKLTENAANTTLDHAEAMQKRNQEDQERLAQLQQIMAGLKAVGESAQQQLESGRQMTAELTASAQQTHDDVFAVLTAQDYQDLTGQIIQKIIALLKDLELKLVNVIQVFGVKLEHRTDSAASDELYGPAYQGKSEALHSQDDVDALLADFGF